MVPKRTNPSWPADLTILVGAFAASSGIAGLAGAASLGIALSFGQIGFAIALLYVLLSR